MGNNSQVVPAPVGTVVAVQANYYRVRLDAFIPEEAGEVDYLLCTRRSRLKKIGQQVMVGDRVAVAEPDWVDRRGAISDVEPRQTQMDRPPVANANRILLVFALAEPNLDPFQLSRFLVKAESTGLSVSLCLNKSDLVTPEMRQKWCDRLHQWGYDPVIISLQESSNLTVLQQQLANTITIVSGPSGVGKSSLINRLIPAIDLRVNSVSGKLGRGRHTTRHVELFRLPGGGLLADSPGFNQPDLNCTPTELAQYFPEARQQLMGNSCQFSNCLHRTEPNCVVRGMWERYDDYLTFLEETIVYQETLNHSSEDEESTKLMNNKGENQLQVEPKLATKKYRQPSRRTQKQTLRDLCHDIEESLTESD
ncbi:MAG: small ribosomal subunit biogenesis GTPase RsgA [Timaviella obliquedivisa GSE-PSE-MK23-08B]|jgi:ribosome biogenesis GTPase|nr:small ribosomal subunit biogenesis GTPase RsgA [Timaviella obliquedivisa GSE-PSE-MK23-08B]